MTEFIKTILQIGAAATLLFSVQAAADPVFGEAVTGVGGTTIDTGGTDVEFFIPISEQVWELEDSTNDSCNSNGAGVGNCGSGAGYLSMYMAFDIDWTGATEVTIDFDDFDAVGFGDNNYFVEFLSLVVMDEGGVEIESWSSAEVLALLTGDSVSQELVLAFETAGDFLVHYTFGTEFIEANTPNAVFGNTVEALNASAVGVPEPATLALLGLGLMVLAFSRRRKVTYAKSN